MSTPEQPADQPLTRKQLREIRNTGATPVISAESAEQTQVDPPAPAAAAPLPRPAEPIIVPPPPVPDAAVDLGISPLTRRQARQQERIRTASVPVITPEVAAAHEASLVAPASTGEPEPARAARDDRHDSSDAPVQSADDRAAPDVITEIPPEPDDENVSPSVEDDREDAPEDAERAVVNPMFGAGLLAGNPAQVELPASFDQILARSTGSVSTSNALIMSQAPEVSTIVAPVTATGEVLITGTLNLPEGLGSTGHARGTADGKEVDAALIDGELPAHSSPTPIAASAAISTVKTAGEVIRPPAPEKGSRLLMTLAITAGALALALVGVLILAFATGVFS